MVDPAGQASLKSAFARALLAPEVRPDDCTPEVARLVAQPAFAVYRNTVMKGCIDALQANYPSVARLFGEEWFRAAAAVFARAHLPRHPTLALYGEGFAAFLAGFAPAAELPYLPDVARVDRFWTEAHTAADEAPVEAAAVARLAPEALAHAVLRPHASARWAWFETQPIATIWRRNRYPDDEAEAEFAWRGEGERARAGLAARMQERKGGLVQLRLLRPAVGNGAHGEPRDPFPQPAPALGR